MNIREELVLAGIAGCIFLGAFIAVVFGFGYAFAMVITLVIVAGVRYATT